MMETRIRQGLRRWTESTRSARLTGLLAATVMTSCGISTHLKSSPSVLLEPAPTEQGDWLLSTLLLVGTAGLLAVFLWRRTRAGIVENAQASFAIRDDTEIERRKAESALLRNALARNRAVLKAFPDFMFLLDENGTYLDYYARSQGDLYVSPEHFVGKKMKDVLPAEVSELAALKFREASSTGEPTTLEYSLMKNNTKSYYEARIVRCDDGKFLSIVRDITASKRAEVELKDAKRFVETIVETLPNLLFIYDYREQRHICMNGGMMAVLGYSKAEIPGMGHDMLQTLVHSDDQPRLEAQLAELRGATDAAVLHVNYRIRDNRNEWRWILGNYAVLDRNEEGTVQRAVGMATDITEHRRVQEELQSLSARLLNFQDEEIRKLAAELHEVIAQDLFAITLNLKRLQQLAASRGSDPSRFDALLAECRTQCERSLQDIRSSSYSLQPPALHDLGIVPTLRWYVEGFAKRSGIQVQLAVTGEIRRLPREMETYLFRVVQQGLTNVAHYSGSKAASVRLKGSSADVTFEIEDYGQWRVAAGFQGQPNAEHWPDPGIQEMRQRLRQLGGCLQIQSTDTGTLIVGKVPVDPAISAEIESEKITSSPRVP
jgi:PAS domain S-box-containing protein